MSPTLHHLAELSHLARLSNPMADVTLPSLSSWPDPHIPQQSIASPARSSSLPMTPKTPGHTYDYARISSSPRIVAGADFRAANTHHHDLHSTWHRLPASYMHLKPRPCPTVPFASQSHSVRQEHYSAVSALHASELYMCAETDFEDSPPDLLVHTTSHHPPSTFFSLEDEEEEQGPGFSFSELGIHTPCYRTSAERGRWKTDPMPYQTLSAPPTRKSVPATESAIGVLAVSRPISEPAPSIPNSVIHLLPVEVDKQSDTSVPEVTSAPSPVILPSLPTSPIPGSMETLPPLTSDRDSSMEADEILTPSSPLPPSSPPFSPVSSLALLPARSLSPNISIASSPFIAPSSPLSPISSEMEDEEACYTAFNVAGQNDAQENLTQDGVSDTPKPDVTPTPHDHLACVSAESTIIELDLPQSEATAQSSVQSPPSGSPRTTHLPSTDMVITPISAILSPRCTTITPFDESIAGNSGESSRTTGPVPKDTLPQRRSVSKEPWKGNLDRTKENIEPIKGGQSTNPTSPDSSLASKKRSKNKSTDGPARKRAKVVDGSSRNAYSSSPSSSQGKAKIDTKNPRSDPAPPEVPTPTSKEHMKDISDHSAPSSRASSVSVPPRLLHSDDKRDPNGIALEDAEICGMMIEGMATSRASSLTIASIYKIVMQNRPSMKVERSEQEWYAVFDRVLHNGTMGQGSGVFGKVDSSYKDNHDRSVEARWFYVPEMDCDQERASLIRSMMPRPGKRTETKKYKQYYYQPLDKISRWDPEDDL